VTGPTLFGDLLFNSAPDLVTSADCVHNWGMKADDANFLELLKKSTQFVVPIYQRVYSWDSTECIRLWDDILQTGKSDHLGAHFTGSIVYVEKDQGTRTSLQPDLIIDGQQRVTTVTLLLAALASHLEAMEKEKQEPVDGFSPEKIRGNYLTNPFESGDRYFKLILSHSDREVLKSIVRGGDTSKVTGSRVVSNFQLFQSLLRDPQVDLVALCLGVKKLVVVDVSLTRGQDNPQLVFEAMNSTGKKLSQADLIRNFVLMDLLPNEQTRLYEDYWFLMERSFAGADEPRFDEFVRHYLTVKTGDIPRVGDIYDAFKEHANAVAATGCAIDELVVELSTHAAHFVAMALGQESDPTLAKSFGDIEQLKATVVYPFLLRSYSDYASGILTKEEFHSILNMVISYLFRRAVCRIPTNSLNKTFADFAHYIDTDNYVESVQARFLTLPAYKRFPTDTEFMSSLCTVDLYHFRRAPYFFRKLENNGRKEEVSTADYSIEHIMPQNENLSLAWQSELGDEWTDVHQRFLHTLGNLTLTGYNPEYSDRPFSEKRDMERGFKDSPLRLNKGLRKIESWNATEISKRATDLATMALEIWPRPVLSADSLKKYQARFSDGSGFDWSVAHDILEHIPAGNWTGYHYLAEAIGTSAQPVANHVSKCLKCVNPYRVLTWDGRIAEGFTWSDPQDSRDPRKVLETEGLRFTQGAADPEQKLATEDLLALIVE